MRGAPAGRGAPPPGRGGMPPSGRGGPPSQRGGPGGGPSFGATATSRAAPMSGMGARGGMLSRGGGRGAPQQMTSRPPPQSRQVEPMYDDSYGASAGYEETVVRICF